MYFPIEIFNSIRNLKSEINRLNTIFDNQGSVICSYPGEVLFSKETQLEFESSGFLVEEIDVEGEMYHVVSK